jgi:hypothetical protein
MTDLRECRKCHIFTDGREYIGFYHLCIDCYAKRPECERCNGTGWALAGDTVNPTWCSVCRSMPD